MHLLKKMITYPLNKLLEFNPSLTRLWKENVDFAKQIPKDALVLDAGAGLSPYKDLFKHAQYESADFEQVDKPYASSTYVCDLKNIPVEEARFDFILFTQVMEHLSEPELVLKELNRVLKPGGKMLYSAPLFYEEHEQPHDFYRYTQFALKHLFSKTGFVIERLDWLEGYFGTVGYQLRCMTYYLPWKPSHLGEGILGYALAPIMVLLKMGFAGLSILFHRLEMQIKYQQQGYPINYVAIVCKENSPEA